jgi:hypothetical protein
VAPSPRKQNVPATRRDAVPLREQLFSAEAPPCVLNPTTDAWKVGCISSNFFLTRAVNFLGGCYHGASISMINAPRLPRDVWCDVWCMSECAAVRVTTAPRDRPTRGRRASRRRKPAQAATSIFGGNLQQMSENAAGRHCGAISARPDISRTLGAITPGHRCSFRVQWQRCKRAPKRSAAAIQAPTSPCDWRGMAHASTWTV